MSDEKRNIGKKTYFWKYLKEHKIEIPIIQRDYAQGRTGKETLRESFITDLLSHINYLNESDRKELKLDFVYGSKPNDSILPLDGQQRLTTLWLLHWFIAYKSGVLSNDEKVKKILKNFTYETRDSSKEFCQELIEFGARTVGQKESITEQIKSNLWFFNNWYSDPTIISMLNMIDTMESLVISYDYIKLWNRLIDEKCPIVFYEITLEDFGLTDDLYIKMNARGKPLTSFENFKADLVNYLKEKDKDYGEKISLLLDTKWTDIFWKNHSSKYEIDEIYFAFMNRLFFNLLITAKKDKDYIYTARDFERNYFIEENLISNGRLKKEGNKFNLYGKSSDDTKLSYSTFDGYAEILNYFSGNFESIEKTLTNLSKLDSIDNKIFLPLWDNKNDFVFIPKYEQNENRNEIYIYDYSNNKIKKISLIDQMDRPIFFAICKYFEYGEYEQESFSDWIRFVWNLCSDNRLRTIGYMVSSIRLINECASSSHSIYQYLKKKADDNSFETKSVLDVQYKEECVKAKQILENSSFKKKIIEAECTAFFNGTIRFLYRGGWDSFDNRLKNANALFIREGVNPNYKTEICKGLIKSLTSWDQLNNEILFDSTDKTWRKILIEAGKYKKAVDSILSIDFDKVSEVPLSKDFDYKWEVQKNIWEKFAKSNLISFLVEKHPEYRLHWHYRLAFYIERNFSDPVVIDWDNFKRNELLNSLENKLGIVVNKEHRIPKCNYYLGENINFVFSYKKKDYNFQWFLKDDNKNLGDIYLMNDDWEYKEKPSHPGKRSSDDHNEYYCFDLREEMYNNNNLFIDELKNLINQI